MSSAAYRLTLTHLKLNEAIALEMQRRWPDGLKLLRLKRLRLRVKDRLTALMRSPA